MNLAPTKPALHRQAAPTSSTRATCKSSAWPRRAAWGGSLGEGVEPRERDVLEMRVKKQIRLQDMYGDTVMG